MFVCESERRSVHEQLITLLPKQQLVSFVGVNASDISKSLYTLLYKKKNTLMWYDDDDGMFSSLNLTWTHLHAFFCHCTYLWTNLFCINFKTIPIYIFLDFWFILKFWTCYMQSCVENFFLKNLNIFKCPLLLWWSRSVVCVGEDGNGAREGFLLTKQHKKKMLFLNLAI